MGISRNLLPTALYTAEQCRALDRTAIEQFGIPGFRLMQRAAQASLAVLQQHWPSVRQLTVICGGGNNGGDGLVLAGLAWQAGYQVQLLVMGDDYAQRLRGEAMEAWSWLGATDVEAEPWHVGVELRGELIVDALLGIGLQGEVRDDSAAVIAQINRSGRPVLALDIPSGLCADTGAILGAAVRADLTLTFIGVKQGLLTHQGVDCTGELWFDGLRVPDEVYEEVPVSAFRTDFDDLAALLPPRARSSHKGNNGHLLVIGGDYGMAGAGLMASQAALRAGAGLVTLATREEHRLAALTRVPELMCHGVAGAADLEPLLARADALVVGPGLGQESWGLDLLGAALESEKPVVLDADALNLLAQSDTLAPNPRWILTPHPGEAARLLETDTREIQRNRFAQVQALQQRYGGTVVLKGAGSLSCDGDAIHLCSAGNPGMATAGMGDILSGVIGALLAQGLSAIDAARAGVLAHAAAGDLAAEQGERGLMATDLLPGIRACVNGLTERVEHE